jgi:hypothetical protein
MSISPVMRVALATGVFVWFAGPSFAQGRGGGQNQMAGAKGQLGGMCNRNSGMTGTTSTSLSSTTSGTTTTATTTHTAAQKVALARAAYIAQLQAIQQAANNGK